MSTSHRNAIKISGAKTNNLKNLSLNIPHHQLVVVTGISGSGKSSLVFELIAKEGQRRYFETLPSFERQFLGKLNRPNVDDISGLFPVIAIGQRSAGSNSRSTVGTLSDCYDWLRLLFARTGTTKKDITLSRALFSFNSPLGKCLSCNGIGKQEKIDLKKLVTAPQKTIREGALAPTLPTGYIMYSQVTIDVLNQVCKAEGFSVDIPWNKLLPEQQNIILQGSTKIKVPFGKHSIASRLKWTGIKAKPREEGHYKGMLPIMTDILRRDRNASILKYVTAEPCTACNGARLNPNALSVTINGKNIQDASKLEISALNTWLTSQHWDEVGTRIVASLRKRLDVLIDLGLGHLSLNRTSKSLRSSEVQRIRVANQLHASLSDVLYIFDEPSIGLHRSENAKLILHLKQLVANGNSVIVVEHNLDTIRSADHLIEIGPAAGKDGGKLLYNGSFEAFQRSFDKKQSSPTLRALLAEKGNRQGHAFAKTTGVNSLRLIGCFKRNLKGIDVSFQLGRLNVVSGKSGAGKASLVTESLKTALEKRIAGKELTDLKIANIENLSAVRKLVFIDHAPIGRTPRSNPATYLGIADHIRDVFAKLPAAKAAGFTKSRFSFNNKGGRCEECQGAGKTQIGMHFLGNIDKVCSTCKGDRFNKETLAIKFENHSIADVYGLSVREAVHLFKSYPKILKGLDLLNQLGLDYLKLGQSSTTLSGGEAQRIKLANQLQQKDTGATLYIIIEPSIGLHYSNIESLLNVLKNLSNNGNTIVCVEQNETIIKQCDWHIELGPTGGESGGYLIHQGPPIINPASTTTLSTESKKLNLHSEITLSGVTTNELKDINVRFPKNKLTVVTGRSGSGKSSLVYDTLSATSTAQFAESLTTYNRSYIRQQLSSNLKGHTGLNTTISLPRTTGYQSKRSTVGTLSGIYDALRLLYARLPSARQASYSAQDFSFNTKQGACKTCEGLGVVETVDEQLIITNPKLPLLDGALSDNKALAYYTNPNGQFIATLNTVAAEKDWKLNVPYHEVPASVKHQLLHGTGEAIWNTTWNFKTKTRSGVQEITAPWLGFITYIHNEFERKRTNKNIASLSSLITEQVCPRCKGARLEPQYLAIKLGGKSISELCNLSILDLDLFFKKQIPKEDDTVVEIAQHIYQNINYTISKIITLGVSHLSLNRSTRSLSGGELQRISLTGQLSSKLSGVTYVLDEPTIGLDSIQIGVLAKALKELIANDNTVVAIEHEKSFMVHADHIIELGPGAGEHGGEVVFQGTMDELRNAEKTLSHQLLFSPPKLAERIKRPPGASFGILEAYANNLKHVNATFYANQLTAVTGVSGSGKSTLIKEVLYKSWLYGRATSCSDTFGFGAFDQVLIVNQSPLAQSRHTTAASFVGLMLKLQTVFAKTPQAKTLNLKRADFSYLSKLGKCSVCSGYGELKVSMDFMSDVWLPCESCKGLRYSREVLACKFKGLNIGEALRLTITEALKFIEDPLLLERLGLLVDLGLGHLKLGQPSNTLSGGEAQRLRLSKSIFDKQSGRTLFLFDEPSTGLHDTDIQFLLKVFDNLLERGDTIVCIDHNANMISVADRVLRLGPGSGAQGGTILK